MLTKYGSLLIEIAPAHYRDLLPFSSLYRNDASVAGASGETVHLVEGNSENIKITTPFDLKVAETLL
jgi:2-C-methyl-D-erythritol 4-phosphate cytidylyltransferase